MALQVSHQLYLRLLRSDRLSTVTYDIGYDNATRPIHFLACSNGVNGLGTRYGWRTQGKIVNFPYIGGAQFVEKWDSVNCGTCWSTTYKGKTIYILAVDRTGNGLNIGLQAMQELAGNHYAVQTGRVDAEVALVPEKFCGLN